MHSRGAYGVREITLSIPGMVCDGCAEKVRKALKAVSGVREAKPIAWRKRVRVRYEPALVDQDQLKTALAAAGFDAADA